MKKGIVICLAMIIMPFFASAQNWLVIKGGGGLGLFNSPGVTNPGLAINSGIGYKHQLTNFMILEGDILLDTRNNEIFTVNLNVNGDQIFWATSATYLQIPITAHFNWLLERKELVPYRTYDSKTNFYVEGGPYFAYGLAVTHYPDPAVVAVWADTESPVTDANLEPNNIDVGVTMGLGISYEFKNMNKLNIGGRFNYGFLDIYKDTRLGSATNMAAVGHVSFDFSLTQRRHIKHRW